MKISIEYDGYEEREEMNCALNAQNYKMAFEEIWDRIFRPHWKHGYSMEIEEIMDKCGDENISDLMDKLSEIYHEIKSSYLEY